MRRTIISITALATFVTLAAAAVAQEVIVEVNSDGAAAGTFNIVSGDWDPSTGKSSAPGLSPSLGTLYVDGGEAALGAFEVNLPVAGLYEVFVTWSQSGNATDVLYTIQHAQGEATRTVVQDGWGGSMASNANQWISLGAYPFDAGAATLTVAAQPQSQPPHTGNTHRTYADAVRMVRSGDSPDTASTPPPAEPIPVFTEPAADPAPAFPQAHQVDTTPSVSPTPPPTPTPAPTPAPAPPVVSTSDSGAIAWHESLSLARQESLSRSQPLAVFAFNHRSRLSRSVTDAVMTNPDVIAAMSEVVPVHVDLQQHPEQSSELSIYRVPTLILYSPQGQEIDRLVGRFTAEEVQTLLSRGF